MNPKSSARHSRLAAFLMLPLVGCVVVQNGPQPAQPASPPPQTAPAPAPEPAKPPTSGAEQGGTPKPKPPAKPPAKPPVKPPAKPPVVTPPSTPTPPTPPAPPTKPTTPTTPTKPEPGKPVDGGGKPFPVPPIQVPPKPDKPSDSAETPKPDGVSHLAIPLRVPFDQVLAKVDALVPTTEEEKEWTRITKEGDSPEVEITYKVWRDKVQASFEGEKLKVTVPLHYAANFRSRVRVPVTNDWVWLTKNDTWGTTADPQDLTVSVTLTPKVGGNWEIESGLKLEPLVHGPAPKGDVCVKVGLKACVSRESLAPKVHAKIDAKVTPKLEAALKKVDGELNAALKLRSHAERLWTASQSPLPLQTPAQVKCPTRFGKACTEPAWLVVAPSALAVGPLTLDKKDLRVDFAMTGRIKAVVGDKPAVAARPLPNVGAVPGTPGVDVEVAFDLPQAALTAALGKALAAFHMKVEGKPDLALAELAVTAEPSSKDKHRVTITLKASGAVEGALKLSGDFAYDAATHVLSVASFSYDDATRALLEKALSPAELEALRARIAEKARVDLTEPLKALAKSVFDTMNRTLPGQLALSGNLDQVALRSFTVGAEGVTMQLALTGKLAAKYTPK